MDMQKNDKEVDGRRPIKTRESSWASSIAASLAKSGITPNQISILSILFAALSGLCLVSVPRVGGSLPVVLYIGAAVTIQCRLLCNLFDGMVAIEGGHKTRSGEIFNDMPDRIADPIILVCAAYSITVFPWVHELGWLAGLLAVMTAYVRVLGVSTGVPPNFQGPMAKQHRMAVITIACLAAAAAFKWSYHAHVISTALAVICLGSLITVFRRAAAIVHALEAQ